jgi:hypothetical protein
VSEKTNPTRAPLRQARNSKTAAMHQLRRIMDLPVGKTIVFELARRVRFAMTERFTRDDPVARAAVQVNIGEQQVNVSG